MRQARRPAPPAQAVRQLRDHARRGPVRRQGRTVPALRPRQRGAGRRVRHLRANGRAEAQVRRRRVPGARHDLRRAPQGHHPPRGLEQGPRDRREDDPRHQGAGGLLRRHPADDRERHVHHQRDRARHRLAAAPVAGRVLPLRGQDPLHRADHPVPRVVGRIRVRRQEPALRPHRPQAQVLRHGVPPRPGPPEHRGDHPDLLQRGAALPQAGRLLERRRESGRPPRRRGHRGQGLRHRHPQGQEDHQLGDPGPAEGGRRGREDRRRRARGGARGPGRRGHGDGRGARPGERGAGRPPDLDPPGEGDREGGRLLPRSRRDRPDRLADAAQGHDPEPRAGAGRDLPPAAAGRPAHRGQLALAVREHVLQPAEVRLLAGRPPQAEHQAGPQHPARREDPAPAGFLRGHQVPAEAAPEPGRRRRHRPPRQPARALGRRAAREPVPHRPGADGAGDQGEDVGLPGNGDRHAARPDQREAGHGRDSRVLRVLAAVAVHGPDQPALRGHAQAPAVGPRAGRPLARARRVRGARRAPDALRPHLPDRDAGRPEHRPDLVAVVLRADQRVRLHRIALPQGQGRAGWSTTC